MNTRIPVERSAAVGGGVHEPSEVYREQDHKLNSHDASVLVPGSQINKGNGTVNGSGNAATANFPHQGMFAGESERSWGQPSQPRSEKPSL